MKFLIYDKDRAWKIAKKLNNQDDIDLAKRLRNQTLSVIRAAKANFVQEELNGENSAKKFWEKINYVMPNGIKKTNFNLIDKNSDIPIPAHNTADYINNFFADIGPNLANAIGNNNNQQMRQSAPKAIMSEIRVTEIEVLPAVKTINNYKSSSIDYLSSRILKDAFLAIIPQLTFLYNKSFVSNKFPGSWKIAKVIPLQKAGDSSDVNNLRPVSLLPLPGKLAERLAHTKISKFLEENQMLNVNQGGFRKNRSTIAMTADFTEDIGLGLNEHEYTLASFVDLRKAFDTVNHGILINKLQEFGLHANTILWLIDYLTDRKQICFANNVKSNTRNMVCGVPQGSILGPILFLLYIDDLENVLDHCKVKLYADDTVLYSTNIDEAEAHANIRNDIGNLYEWCNTNKLTVNIKKTKLMLFGTKGMLKRASYHDVYIGNEKLKYVNNFMYLGIKLDNHLTFESHAKECCRQVSHKNFVFSKIRRFINVPQAIAIFKSMIQPYFFYGDIFLHNISVRTKDKMQKLQNKALRLCLQRDNRAHVPLLHKDSGANLIKDRMDINLLNFMFKRKGNLSLLQPQPRELRRYEACVFKEYISNNRTFESCVAFQGAQKWNLLSVEERNEPTYEGFKIRQRQKLKNKLLGM